MHDLRDVRVLPSGVGINRPAVAATALVAVALWGGVCYAEPAKPPAARAKVVYPSPNFKERVALDEQDLLEQLQKVPEFELEYVGKVRGDMLRYAELLAPGKKRMDDRLRNPAAERTISTHAGHLLTLSQREGLPLRLGPAAHISPKAARVLQALAGHIRKVHAVTNGPRQPQSTTSRKRGREKRPHLIQPANPHLQKMFDVMWPTTGVEKHFDVVPALVQMLQVEAPADRLLLVKELAKIRRHSATEALARRAVFDLYAEVRKEAVAALRKRPRKEYEPILLSTLRYPWAPAADHVAETLVALHDLPAVPELIKMLDLPDPTLPFLDPRTKKYEVRELVRINHFKNCLLCHAPSFSSFDVVRGKAPVPGQALSHRIGGPLSLTYYGSSLGGFEKGAYVRADLTFLRQDFSVRYLVDPRPIHPWPPGQRFDFVVRKRVLPKDEWDRFLEADKPKAEVVYLQREAVIEALRGLTGKDGGSSAAKWKELVGGVEVKGGPPSRPSAPNRAP